MSFLRKQESTCCFIMDSRLCGNDKMNVIKAFRIELLEREFVWLN
jgi:hypothetical protein